MTAAVIGSNRPWYRRYPAAVFLAALALAIITSPYTGDLPEGDFIEAIRLSLVLLTGLLALGRQRRILTVGAALVAPALIGKWLNHWQPDLVPDWSFTLPGLVFVLFVVGHLLHFILRASHVNSEVLCAAAAGYLLLGLLWAMAYSFVAQLSPDAFAFTTGAAGDRTMKGFTSLYFSFVTLSTVGYGDIVAISHPARMLTMVEGVVGIFYTTILLARLVSVYSAKPPVTESDNTTSRG